jgi:hypothetical protein
LIIALSKVNDKYSTMNIFDVQGKLVKSIEKNEINAQTKIDIADLPKGNYILKISTGSGVVSKTFIKQ